jgi:ribosomal protein L11 methyltransferase
MCAHWLEMKIRIPSAAAELLGQSLLELGCAGINVIEQSLDTFEVPKDIDLPEEGVLIRAYFPDTVAVDRLQAEIRQCLVDISSFFPDLIPVLPEYRRLAAEDWDTNWQQHFPPFLVGQKLVIRPSWSEWSPSGQQVVLTLDPGRAFGTGTHATTGLCLDMLARLMEGAEPPKTVLDVGTGSGILALAAAALGAKQIIACDIDPEACLVAAENIHQNGLDDLVTVTEAPLEEIPGQFDLILANILAKENIRLGASLVAHLQPGGHLALSGILIEQEAEVMEAFEDLPVKLTKIDRRDDWSCLTYRYDG